MVKKFGQLELQGITLQNGKSAIQSVLLDPGNCKKIFVEPLSTKTTKGRSKVPPIPVPAYAQIDEQYSFAARLPAFLTVSAMAGFPVRKYIFRPESKDGNTYLDPAQTSGTSGRLLSHCHHLTRHAINCPMLTCCRI